MSGLNEKPRTNPDTLKARVDSMPAMAQVLYGQGEAFALGLGIIKNATIKALRLLAGEKKFTNDPLDRYPMGIWTLASDIIKGEGEFAKRK
jgi:hypothetical protein